ncbi:MAG: formamidopyrimidine-DNA glycosylase [Deltaproteobacteria bacterium]|nr:formamidopyrimidine-DNA glycosylase [Deltaproteobacteria bacterium]
MPELPDIVVYIEALQRRIQGQTLQRVRLASPFVLRTFDPPITSASGRTVVSLERIGKRIAIGLDGDQFLVIHLMISGRLRWLAPGAKVPARLGLAGLDFAAGTLVLTEASTQKRASLHLVQGRGSLQAFHRGGLEPLDATLAEFRTALTRESHTLKRALSDPTLFSGIGNAYSDEMLHRARLSPVRLTRQLSDEEIERLYLACGDTLRQWTDRLRRECGEGFPEKVTAFREDMAVHGRYRKPCPVCGTSVQRIRYASNEVNYCPRCQTEGKLLADRGLSRLLKGDWPRSIDELEELHERRSATTAE